MRSLWQIQIIPWHRTAIELCAICREIGYDYASQKDWWSNFCFVLEIGVIILLAGMWERGPLQGVGMIQRQPCHQKAYPNIGDDSWKLQPRALYLFLSFWPWFGQSEAPPQQLSTLFFTVDMGPSDSSTLVLFRSCDLLLTSWGPLCLLVPPGRNVSIWRKRYKSKEHIMQQNCWLV